MREPKLLQRRPHYNGLPIPANAVIDNGIPDFATTDVKKAQLLARERKCALCGSHMRPPYAFIGGPISAANGLFRDGPMHPKCARYAATVCPFVSGQHRQYRQAPKHHENMTTVSDSGMVTGPESLLLLSRSYETLADGTFVTATPLSASHIS